MAKISISHFCTAELAVREAVELAGQREWAEIDNPITGDRFTVDDDLGDQVYRAARALQARTDFEREGTGIPLPISYDEREALKRGGLGHIVAWYAASWLARLPHGMHPPFSDFAAALLHDPHLRPIIGEVEAVALSRRYPPKPVPGLNPGQAFFRSC